MIFYSVSWVLLLTSRMPVSLICQASSSSSLVDEWLVDPADTAATSLQHLEQLGGEHRPQPTQQLQLLQPPTRGSQRHLKPFNGDPGEVNHLHVLEAPQ